MPAIDRRHPLVAIADACRYGQPGEKVGIAVIDVISEDRSARFG